MENLISEKQLTDRLEEVEEQIRSLENEKSHLDYVMARFLKAPKSKKVDWPYGLGVVAGTVEILKEKECWLSGTEICSLFFAGGWQSSSPKPAGVVISTLNGEILKKKKKGKQARIVRQDGKYGLPDAKWQVEATAQDAAKSIPNILSIQSP